MRHTPLCYFAKLVTIFPKLLKWAVVLFFIGGSLYGIYNTTREGGMPVLLIAVGKVIAVCIVGCLMLFGLIRLYEWASGYLKDC